MVAKARNGREALDAIVGNHPDVLITDIEMPEMTGLELAGELKRRHIPIKVIILTTFARLRIFATRTRCRSLRIFAERHAR